MKARRQEIINKTDTCGCGCDGKDPWHKKTYRRVVTQTSDTLGKVRMPYSSQPVTVTRKDYGTVEDGGRFAPHVFGAWIIDRESIVFDK